VSNRMDHLFKSERYLKIFSFILALTIWFIAVNQGDGIVSTRFQDLQVERILFITPEARDIGQGIVMVNQIPQVKVTLRISSVLALSSGSVLEDFLKAYITLEGLTEGVHTLDVRFELLKAGLNVIKVEPERVEVDLQRIITAEVPVVPGFIGKGVNPQDVVLEPETVIIEGPERIVGNVKGAMVLIKDINEKAPPLLLVDDDGKEIRGVKIVSEDVRVILPAVAGENSFNHIDSGKNNKD
jgi:YbbR domain-containing protein